MKNLCLMTLLLVLVGASTSLATTVTAHFTSAETVPVTAASYTATGNTVTLSLGYAPTTGTNLTVVRNTGLPFINGTFSNLAQGQSVDLAFGGTTYEFVANYYGGTGNDLVLQWAGTLATTWGWNDSGQLGDGIDTQRLTPMAVTATGALAGKTVVSIAAGGQHSLALCSDGALVAWGGNFYGQLGDGVITYERSFPAAVTGNGVLAGKTVVSIAAGSRHNLALCSDGTLVAWGDNNAGQLGIGHTGWRNTPEAVTATGALAGKTVVSVAAGYEHSLALCSDGTLVAWGKNVEGQLGDGSTFQRTTPVAVSRTGALAGKTVVSVATRYSHNLALCSDGTLVAWGWNQYGQLGDGSTIQRLTPVAITGNGALAGKTVVSVAAGSGHCLALCSDGTLAAWGGNDQGQLGDNSTTTRSTPVAITGNGALAGKTVVSVAAGSGHSLALCSDDTLVAWGWNQYGQLGDGSTSQRLAPVAVTFTGALGGKTVVSVAPGSQHSLAVMASPPRIEQPITFAALADRFLKDGATVSLSASTPSSLPITYTLVSGPATLLGSTLILTGPGTVTVRASQAGNLAYLAAEPVERSFTVSKSSQDITFAAIGNQFTGISVSLAATATSALPVTFSVISGPATVTGSTLTPTSVGTVVVRAAQAGTTAYLPVFVEQSFSIQALALDASFTSATTVPITTSRFIATGNTVTLSLGYAPTNGTNLTVVRNTGLPFITGTFSNLAHGQAVNLAFGGTTYEFVANYYGGTGNDLVLQWAGTIATAWGKNDFGQLGDSSMTQRLIPVAITATGALAGKTVVSVAAGSGHSLALCSDGTLAAWGGNDQGQLGDNSTTTRSTPVAITGNGALAGKTVVSVAAGSGHSLALCSDGTLVAWGWNQYGQLGDGSTIQRLTPVAITGNGALAGKTVVSVAAGSGHSLALCSDGTLVAWGYNIYGELGDSSTTQRNTPVPVTATGALAGKTVVSVAAGASHNLALCSDGTLVAWGYNAFGQLGDNSPATRYTPVAITDSGALAGKIVVSVAAGGYHNFALCSDGTLAAWGANSSGALGNNSTTTLSTPVAITGSGALAGKTVVSVAAGGYPYSVAVCSDGTLAAWGFNGNGELGDNSTTTRLTPVAITGRGALAGKTAVSVAAGGTHSLALVASPPRIPQAITFAALTDRFLKDGTTVNLSASTPSSLPITYTVVSGPATLSGTTLTLTGPGIVTVRASQAGNFAYLAAAPVERSFTVSQSAQAITFAPLADRFLKDGTTVSLSASTPSSLPITYTVVSGPATLSGQTLNLTGPGIVTVRASQPGNFAYTAATSVERSFTVSQSSQKITFPALADRFLKDGTSVSLSASIPSGLPITFALVSGPATLSGSTLTLTGPGTVTVRASQAGNFAYTAATPVERSFIVSQSSQEINFPALGDRFLKDGTTVSLTASTPSGLPITFTLVSGPATLSGATLTLTGPGTVTVRASQAGNFAYTAATPVERSFTVSQSGQAITFAAPANRLLKDGTTVSLSASTPSGLPIIFSLVSGPATLSGSMLTLTGPGTVTVRASQAGNFAYTAATPVAQSFSVSKSSQEITFPSLTNRLFRTGLSIPLQATSSSDLAVAYSIVSGQTHASLSGSNLLVQSAGTVVVRASQAGNLAYLPATAKDQSVIITTNSAVPSNLTLSKNWFYDNLANGPEIGQLSVTDADTTAGDIHVYQLVSGLGSKDNSNFTVVGNSLRHNGSFDYDEKKSAEVRIRATDLAGQSTEQAFTLLVLDGNPYAIFRPKNDPNRDLTVAPCYVNAVFQLTDASGRGINFPKELIDQDKSLFSIIDNDADPENAVDVQNSAEAFAQISKLDSAPATVKTVLVIDQSQSIGLANLATAREGAKALVDSMFPQQEIAIYAFSETAVLKQGFTRDKNALKAAIDGINGLSGSTTDLNGSIHNLLSPDFLNPDRSTSPNPTYWQETFEPENITTGFLVVFTDGDDQAGRRTTTEVKNLRDTSGKTIHIVGLLKPTDSEATKQSLRGKWADLANGLAISVENVNELASKFKEVQDDIQNSANSYYWVNYASARRNANRSFTVWLRNNTNSNPNGRLTTAYDASSFTSLEAGVFINRSIAGQSATALTANPGSTVTLSASSLYGDPPSYEWSLIDPNLGSLSPSILNGFSALRANLSDTNLQSRVNLTLANVNATTALKVKDTTNGYERVFPLVIGTGIPSLSGLLLSGATIQPGFNPAITTYKTSVSNSTTSISITPSTTIGSASIKVNGVLVKSGTSSAGIPLKVGSNTITVIIASWNGSKPKTYTVVVERAASSLSTLTNLLVSGGKLSPKFKSSRKLYAVNVPHSAKSIRLTPTAKSKESKIKVNRFNVASGKPSRAIPLKVGKNRIAVEVTAQNGTKQTYRITVTRAASRSSARSTAKIAVFDR